MANDSPYPKPDAPLPDWLKLEKGYSASLAAGKLEVWNDAYPEMRMRMDVSAQGRSPAIAYQFAYEKFQQNLDIYSHAASDLAANYGIEFSRSKDELVISQPDYDLKYTHALRGGANPIALLEQVDTDAAKIWLERDDRLKELTKRGYTMTRSPTSDDNAISVATLTSPDQSSSFSVTLYGDAHRLDKKGLRTVDAALAELDKSSYAAPSRSNGGTVSDAPKPSAKAIARKPKPFVREEEKVSLIFDTSVLKHDALGSPRGDRDRTWLDLLPLTADLPTVDKVIIPAHIADWELRGKVVRNTGNASFELVQIDRHFSDPENPLGRQAASLAPMLKGASRWHIDDEGKGHLIEGKNPNIIIYESPYDKEFARGVLAIHDDPKLHPTDQWKQYQEIRGTYGKNLGEMLMLNAARNLDVKTPAFVISNDINWLQSRDTRVTTNHGQPIGEATLSGYVEAEVKARGDKLREQLEKKYGMPIGDITADRIKRDIMKARDKAGEKYPEGYRGCMPGIYKKDGQSVQGESLLSIFARGAKIAADTDAVGAAAGKTTLQIQAHHASPALEEDKELFMHGDNLLLKTEFIPQQGDTPWVARTAATQIAGKKTLKDLKREMKTLFGDNEVSVAAIARASDIEARDASMVIGYNSDAVPNMSEQKLRMLGDKLEQGLESMGGDAAKVATLKSHYADFVNRVLEEKARKKPARGA